MLDLKTFVLKAAATVSVLTASNLAFSAPITWYDTIADGTATFNNMITNGGGSSSSYTLDNLAFGSLWDFGDFSIETSDSSFTYDSTRNNSTGGMININPSSIDTELSGITFTFDNAINSIGFEVGDWGTCCQPSSLYFSLGGGPAQLVATANSYNDNPTVANGGGLGDDTIFVGAVDSSTSFTTVTFYGDGAGEFLTAGGTILYGNVAAVPEPESYAMLLTGLGLMSFVRRKQA